MAINISDYKKVYNVAECAGITNFDMTDADNRLDVYNKIADWINGDEELSEIFTAEVVNFNTNYDYYSVRLKTSTGFFAAYGFYNGNNYKAIFYGYYTNGGDSFNSFSSTICEINNLSLMVIKGNYGCIFGLYSTLILPETQVKGLICSCMDDNEQKTELGVCIDSSNLRFIRDSFTSSLRSYALSEPSTSSVTALSSFLVPSMNLLSENCRIVDGHRFTGLTFFEAGGKKWCIISPSTSYKGLALLME